MPANVQRFLTIHPDQFENIEEVFWISLDTITAFDSQTIYVGDEYLAVKPGCHIELTKYGHIAVWRD